MIWATKSATNNEPIKVSAVINDIHMHTQTPPEYSWNQMPMICKEYSDFKNTSIHINRAHPYTPTVHEPHPREYLHADNRT